MALSMIRIGIVGYGNIGSQLSNLAEAMGMTLPGAAAIPAPYRDRYEMAYLTGKRIVEMVWENLIPSKILTREAFENAITLLMALGGLLAMSDRRYRTVRATPAQESA